MGEDYTEERITQRIKGIAIDRGPRRRSAGEISLRIALEDSIKAQQSAGYARWAKLHNLKQAANSLNFITEHQIDSYEGLESRLAEISAVGDAAASALKDAERRLGDMALLIKYSEAKQKLKEYGIVKQNVDSILRTAPGKELTQER